MLTKHKDDTWGKWKWLNRNRKPVSKVLPVFEHFSNFHAYQELLLRVYTVQF